MIRKIKMEILFGTEPVLLVSPLTNDLVARATCEINPNGVFSLVSGGASLATLEIPDYLRDRLEGRDRLYVVEIENDEPVRQHRFRLNRPEA